MRLRDTGGGPYHYREMACQDCQGYVYEGSNSLQLEAARREVLEDM